MSQSRFSVFDFVKALQAKVQSELIKVHATKDGEAHDFDNEVERKKLEAMMEKIQELQDRNGKLDPADVERSFKEQIRQILAANLIQVYVNEKERSWGVTKLGDTFSIYQNIIENAIALPVGEGKASRADNYLLPENYKHTNESEFLRAFLGLIDSNVLVESVMKDAVQHLDAAATAHASYMANKKDSESEKTYKDELEKYVSSMKVIVRLQEGVNHWNDLVAKYFQNIFFNLDEKSKKEKEIRSKAKKVIEHSSGDMEATLADLRRVAALFKEVSPEADKLAVQSQTPASEEISSEADKHAVQLQTPAASLLTVSPVVMHVVSESDLIRGTGTPPSLNKRLTARQSDSPHSTPPSQSSRLPTTPPLTPEKLERTLQEAQQDGPVRHSPPISPTKGPTIMTSILEVETKESKHLTGAALTSTNTESSPTPSTSPADDLILIVPPPPAAPALAKAASNNLPPAALMVAAIVSSNAPPPPPPIFSSPAKATRALAAKPDAVPTLPPMAPALSSNVPTPPPMAPAITNDVPPPPPPSPPKISSTAQATQAIAAKSAPKSVLSAPDFASQLAAQRNKGLRKTTTVDKSAPLIESSQPAASAAAASTTESKAIPAPKGPVAVSHVDLLAQGVSRLKRTNIPLTNKTVTEEVTSPPAKLTAVPNQGPSSPSSGISSTAALASSGMFAGSVNVSNSSPVTSPVTSPVAVTKLPGASAPYRTTSGSKPAAKYGKDGRLLGSPTSATSDGSAELNAKMQRQKEKEAKAMAEAAAASSAPRP